MTDKTLPPMSERFPYTAPRADAGASIPPATVTRRADHVLSEIEELNGSIAALQGSQQEAMRRGDFNEAKRISRELTGAKGDLQALQTQLAMAVELDLEEGVSTSEDDWDRQHTVSMKHLEARAPHFLKMAEGLAMFGEGAAGAQACADAALQHLHANSRHLPRKLRVDLVHDLNRYVTGGPAIHALVRALASAGVGTRGIHGGVILDVASGQVPDETFESALATSNQRIRGMLDHWRKLVKGDKRPELTIEPPPTPTAAPQEIKWADHTHIGAGGQKPGWKE